MNEQPENLPRCADCPLRKRAEEKPKSILGRLWYWHIQWCRDGKPTRFTWNRKPDEVVMGAKIPVEICTLKARRCLRRLRDRRGTDVPLRARRPGEFPAEFPSFWDHCGGWYGARGKWPLPDRVCCFRFSIFLCLGGTCTCSHCPYWAEEGNVLHCHANYGVFKIWKFNPKPMSR